MQTVKKRKKKLKFLLMGFCVILAFAAVFAATFFGVQYFTKTGIFKIPGVVYYDDSLTEDEVALFQNIFTEEIVLDSDVKISARNELTLPELNAGEFLSDIRVAVTDFYDTENNITADTADDLLASDYHFIDLDDLDYSNKLLKINDKYYLDDFNAGAIFRVISFESEKYEDEIKPLVVESLNKEFPTKDSVLTLAQTGVTALSRGMNRKLATVGDATYFAEQIKDYLSQFDLTHTSNESSFTDYASSENICSNKKFIDTLTAIGLDIVELAGNHNQDCGDQAAIDSIDIYNNNDIKIVGGGKTASEAAVPLEIDEKGNSVTMLAYNLSTGGATHDDTPGANQYYEETAAAQISEAKARGDVVIVDIQYYECSSYDFTYENATCDRADSAAGDQVGFFRHLIDLGADVVVGTSAHQPQTYELYGDGVIYYGLGNLFFDQIWWPGTTRSLILVHHFYKDKLLQTEIVPTVYDENMQTRLMDEDTAKWFLQRLSSVRPYQPAAANETSFQSTIDEWANSVGGQKGVVIYDLDKNKLVGSYNSEQKFETASLYKLFVVYEGYRRVQNGSLDKNAAAGSTGYTIGECLDLSIRESYSPCAETIWSMIGHDELDNIVKNEFGMVNMKVSDLEATPTEIMKIMKKFYKHSELKDQELVNKMWDSFLMQPTTTYNWRQGLPSGFSDKAAVYNKVGWNYDGRGWTIYDDAAIVTFKNEGRNFIVVVMTSGVTYQQIRDFGTKFEETFYKLNQ